LYSRFTYLALTFLLVALTFVSCKKQLSDEQLFDRLQGNWDATMKVMEYESFHYEVDSTLFHSEGRRLGIIFSSKGNFQKTFEEEGVGTYWVEEGDLVLSTSDTASMQILHVNARKLVLQFDSAKVYFEKYVY
tara:strand:- start:4035 stop:4433 length:399 start_codon:yes stop_codon:yes gene_type:complete